MAYVYCLSYGLTVQSSRANNIRCSLAQPFANVNNSAILSHNYYTLSDFGLDGSVIITNWLNIWNGICLIYKENLFSKDLATWLDESSLIYTLNRLSVVFITIYNIKNIQDMAWCLSWAEIMKEIFHKCYFNQHELSNLNMHFHYYSVFIQTDCS